MGTMATEREKSRVRTFRDLIAWQKGMEFAELVYQTTQAMPDSEKFGLTSQMRRAAVSIPSNIAEGHGRESRADYIRFLKFSRGSLMELQTQLTLAVRLKFLSPTPELTALSEEVDRVLQGLIRGLERLCRDEA